MCWPRVNFPRTPCRVLIVQSVSICFIGLQFVCEPFCRPEDNWLMILVQFSLVLVFSAVQAVTSCELDPDFCSAYGFGASSTGVFSFFAVFSTGLLTILLAGGVANLWLTGNVPKFFRVASQYSLSPTVILRRAISVRVYQYSRAVLRAMTMAALAVDTGGRQPVACLR